MSENSTKQIIRDILTLNWDEVNENRKSYLSQIYSDDRNSNINLNSPQKSTSQTSLSDTEISEIYSKTQYLGVSRYLDGSRSEEYLNEAPEPQKSFTSTLNITVNAPVKSIEIILNLQQNDTKTSSEKNDNFKFSHLKRSVFCDGCDCEIRG